MGFETARELGAEKLTVITWYHEDEEETKSGIRVHYTPSWKWLLRPSLACPLRSPEFVITICYLCRETLISGFGLSHPG
ncbi:MAG TPA: hypothetical protein VK469_16945 [Candidatus Kapabacteria bacterium]|nr:hypothetical protein [Candidatus Kapabacteria bacterium]